jgi:hypothetical protein
MPLDLQISIYSSPPKSIYLNRGALGIVLATIVAQVRRWRSLKLDLTVATFKSLLLNDNFILSPHLSMPLLQALEVRVDSIYEIQVPHVSWCNSDSAPSLRTVSLHGHGILAAEPRIMPWSQLSCLEVTSIEMGMKWSDYVKMLPYAYQLRRLCVVVIRNDTADGMEPISLPALEELHIIEIGTPNPAGPTQRIIMSSNLISLTMEHIGDPERDVLESIKDVI